MMTELVYVQSTLNGLFSVKLGGQAVQAWLVLSQWKEIVMVAGGYSSQKLLELFFSMSDEVSDGLAFKSACCSCSKGLN